MNKRDYDLKYEAEKIDELLTSVDEKTIYPKASSESDGLMSQEDKKKLDDIEPITNEEIAILLSE